MDNRTAATITQLEDLFSDLDISFSTISLLKTGSNLVFSVDRDIVAKVVPSEFQHLALTEAKMLQLLEPIPNVVVKLTALGPGPFSMHNSSVILTKQVETLPTPPSPEEIMFSLEELHKQLKTLPTDTLPSWKTHVASAQNALAGTYFSLQEKVTLHAAYNQFVLPLLNTPLENQLIHGDAWSQQVINTSNGLVWLDFESSCYGPIEWDLAGFEEVEGYKNYDKELWHKFRLIKIWCTCIWVRRIELLTNNKFGDSLIFLNYLENELP